MRITTTLKPRGTLAELVGLDEIGLNVLLDLVMCPHGLAILPESPKDLENRSTKRSLRGAS